MIFFILLVCSYETYIQIRPTSTYQSPFSIPYIPANPTFQLACLVMHITLVIPRINSLYKIPHPYTLPYPTSSWCERTPPLSLYLKEENRVPFCFYTMALRVPKASGPQLFREGYRVMQGVEDAVIRNCNAIRELSEIVRAFFNFFVCGF